MASTDKKSCIGESEFVGDYFTTQNKPFFLMQLVEFYLYLYL